jgi:hypothetical protein
MIGGGFTVRHERNAPVPSVRGGRLATRHLLRCASPWLSEVSMQVYQRRQDQLRGILRTRLGTINPAAARLGYAISPLQPRNLSTVNFHRGNSGAST